MASSDRLGVVDDVECAFLQRDTHLIAVGEAESLVDRCRETYLDWIVDGIEVERDHVIPHPGRSVG